MDKLHSTIRQASRAVRLDPQVKAGFRRTLAALTDSPAAVPAGSRLPRALAWALAAFVVASTGATATYASTRALPGDALYGMKVGVVEPAESALAFSADAKADVAVAHLERRFQEAAALSAEGTLDQHDAGLATLAERDVAVVERDDQPVARARLEALAATYGPRIRLTNVATSRFAAAVRLDAEDEVPVPDYVAKAAAQQQLIIAEEKGNAAKQSAAASSAAVSFRLKTAGRLSQEAADQLTKGSYQAALKLSGAAAQAALEAQLFAGLSSSTTSTPPTTTSTTSTASSSPSSAPHGSGPGGSPGGNGNVGGILRNLLH